MSDISIFVSCLSSRIVVVYMNNYNYFLGAGTAEGRRREGGDEKNLTKKSLIYHIIQIHDTKTTR